MRQELPPFEVPATYAVEPELRAPIPRPVPDSIVRHPQRLARLRLQRRISAVMLSLSVAMIAFQDGAFLHVLGLYFTPFAYPGWLGGFGAAISLWGLFSWWHPWRADPYRYLRQGVVVVGRVVDLRWEVAQRVNGADSSFAYDVYLEFPDPQTQELVVAALRSPEVRDQSQRLTCKVGDYLTAVYLPGQVGETLTLYGFTGVNPERNLLQHDGSGAGKAAALLCLGGVFAMIYGMFCYPVHNDEVGSLFQAVLVPAVIGTVVGWKYNKRARAQQVHRAQLAVAQGTVIEGSTVQSTSWWGASLLGAFCGALIGLGTLMCLNGALDFHAPTSVPVKVINAHSRTYNGLFSTYQLEYVDPETKRNEKIGINPLDLERDGYASLLTHRGALGWRWQEMKIVSAEP